MTVPAVRTYRNIRRGIELGFIDGYPLVYDGTEPVAIDAQAGKGKLTRFLGVNLVSPRTDHLTKIITDPKDGELAWVSWVTLKRQGYRVLFFNVSTPSASSSDPPKQKSPLPWVRPHWGRARDALADDRGAWGPAAA